MSRIKVKNFGPIKEGCIENDGWIDIEKVTVFIGDQGSGKSTIAKLFSTFTWIEKVLERGDVKIKEITNYSRFRKNCCGYHRIENYFFDEKKRDIAELEYEGDAFKMKYYKGKLTIDEIDSGKYRLPQIMYVPAERNFISTIQNLKLIKLSSESLVEFLTEFENSKNELNEIVNLPINNTKIEYDKLNDILHVIDKSSRVRLTEASSGFQSVVPLFIVSRFLSKSLNKQTESMSNDERTRFKKFIEDIMDNTKFTEEQKRAAFSVIASRFNKSAFINIVEEPEQNLFPSSQKHILFSLLEFNNSNENNKLLLTTHSPYIISYLSAAIQGAFLEQLSGNHPEKKKIFSDLDKIIPLKSTVDSKDVAIYQFDERNGTIKRLPNYEGIPSDKNYLNEMLADGNHIFDALLELEETI